MAQSQFHNATDLTSIKVEQATMLKERAIGSAIIVEIFVILYSIIIWSTFTPEAAIIWLLSASLMVAVTVLYAKYRVPNDINADNVDKYLFGHILICAMTGAVWGGYAIYALDFTNPISLIISGSMPMILTVGGMMPSSAYRPGYIALASLALIPYGLYLIMAAPGSLRFFGIGTLVYFGLAMISSAQAELNTRDGIIARTKETLNEKLMKQNEIIKKASEDKTRFLAATSHDLSQPLHAQGYFIQALRKMLSADDQHDLLDKIENSWRAQGKLLEGLVDITRLDSHAIKPKPRVLNLKSEMQSLMSEFKTFAYEKSISLTTDFEEAIIFTDPVLLARIVRNILSNAIKFTPDNGKINVSVVKHDQTASIIIQDNGIGIPESEYDSIFDEYTQLGNENRDRSQGLGLGLSIVKRLAQLLDFKIELISKPKEGSTFKIVLPLHDGQGLPISPKPRGPRSTFSTSPLIVLVDDEKDIRDGMSALLTNWGCQIICTPTGNEAISLLSNTPETPALLIIDKRLANGENGIDVIDSIREEVNETIPAILITGDISGFEDIKDNADIQVMNKPVEPNEIKRIIRETTTPSDISNQT